MSTLDHIQRQKFSQASFTQSKTQTKNQLPFYVQTFPYRSLIVYQKKGHWSQKQKLKYVIFLQYFKERFQVQTKRRFCNVFQLMAKFIKTRNSYQCRSHHQKMQKQKFKIDSIVFNIASKYHPRVYQQLKQKYTAQIISLNQNIGANYELFKQKQTKFQSQKNKDKQELINYERVLRSMRKKVKKNQNRQAIRQSLNERAIQNEKDKSSQQKLEYTVKIQHQNEEQNMYKRSNNINFQRRHRNHVQHHQSFDRFAYGKQNLINQLDRKSLEYNQKGHYHFVQFNSWIARSEQCYQAITYLLQMQKRQQMMINQRQ